LSSGATEQNASRAICGTKSSVTPASPSLYCIADQPGCEFCSDECPLARAIKTSQPAEASGFLHHKAGHEIPVRVRAVPVHNQHGSIIGAAETFEELQPVASASREEPRHLAEFTDGLTGVANRASVSYPPPESGHITC
jgi:hypothetical protein